MTSSRQALQRLSLACTKPNLRLSRGCDVHRTSRTEAFLGSTLVTVFAKEHRSN